MCDATRLVLVAEPLDASARAFWFGRLRCEACHWPHVYAVLGSDSTGSVSYTHLTLPTNREV